MQDAGVAPGVQAGEVAHLEVVGRFAQGSTEIEVEAVGDQGTGTVVTETDRADDSGDGTSGQRLRQR